MQTKKQYGPQKLRILCLHGWNNTGTIMMYQMQNFVNTFGDLCEFQFLDGPHVPTNTEPIKFFVDKGIVPPYKSWMRQKYLAFVPKPDGMRQAAITKTIPNYEGSMEAVYYIVEYMNRQDQPFDGFACFS